MSSTNNNAVRPASPEAIDASCRWPVLVLLAGGVGWLALSSVLGFFATMKFHKPDMFADCPFFSYGRLVASSQSLLLYGFGVSVAMGIAMWLMARLGRTTLAGAGAALVAALFWHTGVMVMWVSLALGMLTGNEWFEVPKVSAAMLFAAYAVMAVVVLLNLAGRKEKELYPSQWFVLAAVLWFGWIFATACALIHCHPAGGLVSTAIQYWYGHNLVWIFFGFVTMATAFYFVPKLSGTDLHSRELAAFTFWVMLAIGGLGGVPHGVPLPSWMASTSTACVFLLLIPVIGFALNLQLTMKGKLDAVRNNPVLGFVVLGAVSLVVGAVLLAGSSARPFNGYTGLTLFNPGLTKLLLQGMVGLTFIGALLHIIPAVTGVQWPVAKVLNVEVVNVKKTFLATVLGVVLAVAFLVIGGIKLGWLLSHGALADANPDKYGFPAILNGGLMYIRMATLGDLALVVGHGLLLINVKLLIYRQIKACCGPCLGSLVGRKPAEVGA